mgnify:CR=1 FL=1
MEKRPSNRILYTPAKIGTMELKNRWIMLAMHTGYAQKDGGFSKRDYAFYRERAVGGMAAITLVGAVNEEAEQEHMHRLDRPELAEGLKKVCDVIHEADTKVIVQLFHAGRNKRTTDEQPIMPVAPSAVPSPIYRTMPRVMSEDDIQRTIADFANAAKHCRDCGADAVEVSVSAGYLLSQFLSPLVNQRTDAWGGDSDARMRFPTAALIAIREAVGKQYPILIKISGGDMLGGYDLQYMADFINQLPAGTVNGVTVTGGWHEAPVPQISYHAKPGAFSYLARQIREKSGLPVIACNRIHTEDVAEQILEAGDELTEGSVNPHDILKIKGLRAVQDYMIQEVQRVYRLQGVEINDKHIEVLVRQMLKKIRIEEAGESGFLPGTMVDVLEFEDKNEELAAEGLEQATGEQIMLGITKASLATNSFLSAASFQETTKVLTEAAIKGKVDHLCGMKENVIIGKPIPAGTGMRKYRDVKLSTELEMNDEITLDDDLVFSEEVDDVQ